MPPTTQQWDWIKSLSGSPKTERRENTPAAPGAVKLNSGKDEVSGKIAKEASKEVKKNGFKAGAVVGLHANVEFKIGDPVGDPKRYPVKLTVSFGGSAKVSGSAGKGAVGVELKGSVDRTMIKEYKLSEEELGGYVKALRAASSGSKVAAKEKEFAIIAAGVTQGWDAAQQLWKGAGHPTADSVKHKGDSITVTEKSTSGASVKGKGKGVSVEVGTTDSREKTTKVTRNDKDKLDVKTDTSHKKETNLKGSMDVGVVGLEVGKSHTRQTSFGFSITVDPKKDPDGKILAWLNNCTKQEHYAVFLSANLGKVTLTEQRKGSLEAFGTTVGLSLGGRRVAGIYTKQSVDEQVVRDGQGRLVKKTVTGKAGAGGDALWHSDSEEDEAVAEIDGKGNASVKLTTTKTDGDTIDKSGLNLSNDDLKVIGGIAVRSLGGWNSAIRRADEREDWIAAGKAIAKANGAPGVVAEQLARFVGTDRVERMNTFRAWVRNGYKGRAIGRRFEFPAALKRLQESYEVVTADSLIDEINKIGESNPAAAVEKCKSALKVIDLLDPQIRKSDDFENSDIKMEMLRRLGLRRDFLAKGINGFSGKPEEDLASLKNVAARLQKQLGSFLVEQARVGEKLHDLLAGYPKYRIADLGEAKGLIRQLSDIHGRWWNDYRSMRETQSKLGNPKWDTPPTLMPVPPHSPMFRPHEEMLARFEKAAGIT